MLFVVVWCLLFVVGLLVVDLFDVDLCVVVCSLPFCVCCLLCVCGLLCCLLRVKRLLLLCW